MSKDFDYKLLDNMKESDTNGEKLYYIHTYGCQMNEDLVILELKIKKKQV